MFGIFNFFNKQASEQQKTYQVYQQQYQNTQNVSQRLDIMKNIINLRQDQEYPSLETLSNYYKFIVDYQKCHRSKLEIDKQITEEYQLILQKFLDPLTFDKIQEQVVEDSSSEQFDFLRVIQLSFMFDKALGEAEYGQLKEIMKEMMMILQKQENSLITQLMGVVVGYCFLNVDQQEIGPEIQLLKLLNGIRELNSNIFQMQKMDYISENQIREFLYDYELNILNGLVSFYFDMNQVENFIEYQNQCLQLVKDNEGISKHYLDILLDDISRYGHLNKYRSLQLIEETCLQIEKNEDFFFLQLSRILFLSALNQLSQQDYQSILSLYDELKISTPGNKRLFYVAVLICDIQLKQFKDYSKYIDLLIHPYKIGDGLIQQLMELRYQIKYEINNNSHSNQSVFKDFLSYYENKILPLYKEVKKTFIQNFFELSKNQQRSLYNDMKTIIQDQLHKGIIEDDQKFNQATLEELVFNIFKFKYKIQLVNPRHRDNLIQMFNDLKQEPTMSAQVIAQLLRYIRLLQDDKNK